MSIGLETNPVRSAWRNGFCAALIALAPFDLLAATAQPDDWRAEANARIEQIRKRDVEILVVDRLGNPVPGSAVVADQIRHRFAFGSCINTNALSNPQYAAFVTSHFEWAVFENESKWFLNEQQRDHVNYRDADELALFCAENGILLRGHCLFWAKEEYTPPWCRSLPEDELRGEVEERIDDAVPHFRGTFLHWDVNNEMLDGDFFRRRLGSDIEPHMFIRTHELDPGALLFVNDYSTVECCPSRTQAYIDQVRSLQSRGAPVQAVGVQGHFWGPTVDPVLFLDGLDDLATLGLPIWITEYDTVNPDENARAEALESAYRAAFSHPAVEGILMWGFWAGSHWRGADAAIVNLDWTLNAAGHRYEALMAEWTTEASGATDGAGVFPYRGIHGTYLVSVQSGSASPAPTTIEVSPGEGPAVYLIPLKPGSCFPAAEVEDLLLSHDRASGVSALTWRPVPWRADMGSVYDVLRSADPGDFAAATCVESNDGSDQGATDSTTPTPGSTFFYLVRGEYQCAHGEGTLGRRSDGTERTGRPCP